MTTQTPAWSQQNASWIDCMRNCWSRCTCLLRTWILLCPGHKRCCHSNELTPCRFGAFLAHVAQFDAAAFGISAAEATLMDPQQRLLLETIAEGQAAASSKGGHAAEGSCGVFVGVSSTDYQRLTAQQSHGLSGYNATSTTLR